MIPRSPFRRYAAESSGTATRASLLLTLALLAGCATTAAQDGEAVPEPAPGALTGDGSPLARISPDVIYYVGAAEILGQRKQFLESARYYRRAAALSDDPEIAARALRVAAFANDEALTLAGVERWLELAPDAPEPHRFAAILHLRAGDPDRAWEHVDRYLTARGGSQGWDTVGEMLGAAKDRAAARAVLERLLSERTPPRVADVLAGYSELAVQLRLLEEAEQLTTTAIGLDPERVDGWRWRARIRQSLERFDEAREDYARAVALAPGDPALRRAYAALLAEQEDYTAALEQLAEVPDSVPTLYSRALYAEALGERQRALADYERLRALEDVEDESRRAFLAGQLAEMLDRPTEQVLASYREVTSGEHLEEARLRSAVVLARAGELAQARVMLGKLQNGSAETAAMAFQAEAALLREADQDEAAMAVYDEAIRLLPDDTELLFARALHAEALDRIDRTEADLRRILELKPEDPNALNALGYTLTDRTDRHAEALELIEAAYEQLPDEAAVVDSMGWVHFKLGNLDRAREYLERAMELASDPEIAAHLGEVLWHLGERERAREIWARALEAQPDAEPVLETRGRLTGE